VEQKSSLREAGLAGPEGDGHVTAGGVHVDDLTSKSSTVAEECPVTGRDLQVVVASTASVPYHTNTGQSQIADFAPTQPSKSASLQFRAK